MEKKQSLDTYKRQYNIQTQYLLLSGDCLPSCFMECSRTSIDVKVLQVTQRLYRIYLAANHELLIIHAKAQAAQIVLIHFNLRQPVESYIQNNQNLEHQSTNNRSVENLFHLLFQLFIATSSQLSITRKCEPRDIHSTKSSRSGQHLFEFCASGALEGGPAKSPTLHQILRPGRVPGS